MAAKKPRAKKRAKIGGRGGAGASGADEPLMDSAPENFSTMAGVEMLDLDADKFSKIVSSYRPAGELTAEERQARIRLVQRLVSYQAAENQKEKQDLPAGWSELDNNALWWVVARCKDSMFRHHLEKIIMTLVKDGCIFDSSSSPVTMISTLIERLMQMAVVPPNNSDLPETLRRFMDPQRDAQESLATVASYFIATKTINKSIVMPWLVEESKRPHFRAKWKQLRRQATPHNRIQFGFVFDCLVEVDAFLKCLFNGPLAHEEMKFPPPRTNAANMLVKIKNTHPSLVTSADLILDEIEKMQAVSRYALGMPWGSGWAHLRSEKRERVMDLLEPFIKGKWTQVKKSAPQLLVGANVDKNPWKIAWRPLSKCLVTILKEWPYPPLDPSVRSRLINKHCVRN